MKAKFFTTAAALALFIAPGAASASDQGWYIRGNAGYGVITDSDLSGNLVGTIQGTGEPTVSAGVGYAFGNNWRMELDAAQLWNDLGAIDETPGSTTDLRATTGMINAIYDFTEFERFEPYLGAGVGLARTSLSGIAHDFTAGSGLSLTSVDNPTCTVFAACAIKSSDTGFAWQLLGGLGYKFTQNLHWDTQYRYTRYGSGEYDGEGFALGSTTANPITAKLDGAGAHSIMTGFRYTFGSGSGEYRGPVATTITCWDGSTASEYSSCPAEPPRIEYVTCWDGSQVESGSACPAEPQVQCWDGSTVRDASSCPVQQATVSCWDGSLVYDASSCPAQPAPAPAPVIDPLCGNGYTQETIYYEFNKPQSAETEGKIARILDIGRSCDVGNITVVGHTDSSGSAAYNLKLSEKRAADVRAELIRRGLPGGIITSEGKGETQLFIDTGDGVKEQLNRRTEVLIRLNSTQRLNF